MVGASTSNLEVGKRGAPSKSGGFKSCCLYLKTSFFLQVDSLKGRMVAKTTNTETELLLRALEPALKSFLANKLDEFNCQLPHSLDIREM